MTKISSHIIANERHFALYRSQQMNQEWKQHQYRKLSEVVVGILGFGITCG